MASDGRPPQPKAILRGHKAQVHAAVFCRQNERLLTGDADGFVVVWDLAIMRPRSVWQAHTNAILGLAGWGDDRIITHGRDNRLVVWKLREADEATMSTALPLDPSPAPRPQPWMMHMLEVNTMNFCSFSSCAVHHGGVPDASELLVAVPNTLASEAIDIFHIPSQERLHTVSPEKKKNGMVMALSLFYQNGLLTFVAGYESGGVAVMQLDSHGWATRYQSTPHSQPVLSLDISPAKDFFFTSGADAVIAKHPLPTKEDLLDALPGGPEKQSTGSASGENPGNNTRESGGGISALSAAFAEHAKASPSRDTSRAKVPTVPLKVVNTKHSGQQSLRVRSDGKIFVTAGWDSKIRVYSSKTMKEVAVLKWHQAGCYAAALAEVSTLGTEGNPRGSGSRGGRDARSEENLKHDEQGEAQGEAIVVPRLVDVTVKDKRLVQARTTHWLASGSKDGKVSLWDVF